MALVEMPEFAERAEKFLSAAQRQQLLWWIAAYPDARDLGRAEKNELKKLMPAPVKRYKSWRRPRG